MADGTYQPKAYRKQGGDEIVIADGGVLRIESGGSIELESGGSLNVAGAVSGPAAYAAYPKTTTGVQTLLPANATTRAVFGHITVTEAFANNGGVQPKFSFGETDSATKFATSAKLATSALGAVFTFAGQLSANKALIVTALAATSNDTGGIQVVAMALPSA